MARYKVMIDDNFHYQDENERTHPVTAQVRSFWADDGNAQAARAKF